MYLGGGRSGRSRHGPRHPRKDPRPLVTIAGGKDDMKTLALTSPHGKLTRPDIQAAVESKLREIQAATTELLQQINATDPAGDEMLRAEAARLNEIGFTLTRLLCHDRIEQAFAIVSGDDVAGEVQGLTA